MTAVLATPPVAATDGRPSPRSTTRFRTDLEGLRVIAILLVAVYHVWFHRVSGGVDVFLLLSGYFIGGSLWRKFSAGSPPRPLDYARRHLRRLLPAPAVVAAVTVLGIWWWIPETRWASASQELLASLGFYENWQLISSGSAYGAADSSQSVWQHFWSLSVQAQLFLAVPLLLACGHLVARRRATAVARTATTLILLTFASSLAYACWSVAVDQRVAYFHTFARAWEFLAGTALAMLLSVWTPRHRAWRAGGWIGIAALLATGLVVEGGSTFPGPAALLPTGAAALVIVGGAHGDGALSRTLGSRWLAPLGRYAYAFYLWHWPLLVFVLAARETVTPWSGLGILLGSAALAYGTYHLIESPARDGVGSARRWARGAAWGLGSAAVAAAGVWWSWSAHIASTSADIDVEAARILSEYPGALAISQSATYGGAATRDPLIPATAISVDYPQVVTDGCITPFGSTKIPACVYGDPDGARTAVLVGASHAEQWFSAVDQFAQAEGMRLIPLIKPGCPFNASAEGGAPDDCVEWLESVLEHIEELDPDLVFTTATRSVADGAETVPAGYRTALTRLAHTATVVGIRDNPVLTTHPPEEWLTDPTWTAASPPAFSRARAVTGAGVNTMAYVDMNDLICPEGTCAPVVGNRFVFRDNQHLAASYVVTMADAFVERVRTALAAVQPTS